MMATYIQHYMDTVPNPKFDEDHDPIYEEEKDHEQWCAFRPQNW